MFFKKQLHTCVLCIGVTDLFCCCCITSVQDTLELRLLLPEGNDNHYSKASFSDRMILINPSWINCCRQWQECTGKSELWLLVGEVVTALMFSRAEKRVPLRIMLEKGPL